MVQVSALISPEMLVRNRGGRGCHRILSTPASSTSSRGSRPTTRGSGPAIRARAVRVDCLAGRPPRSWRGTARPATGRRPSAWPTISRTWKPPTRAPSNFATRCRIPHHVSPCTGRRERPRDGKRQRGQRGAGAPLAAARSLLCGGHARAGAGRRVRRVGLSPAGIGVRVGRSGHAALPRSRRRAMHGARSGSTS